MESTKRLNATKYGYMPCSITIKVREPGSAFTHLAGFLGVLVGAGPLLMRAREFGSAFTYAGMIIFILSALVLYGASTSFHWVVAGERVTNVFRKLDHMSISILIAGTYTPVCLTALRGRGGYIMLAAIWGLAISSMIIKAFWYYFSSDRLAKSALWGFPLAPYRRRLVYDWRCDLCPEAACL